MSGLFANLLFSEFWHPNVYKKDGQVCISILHSPGNDPTSGEKPEERWSPAQTVSTIMLSFLSLLSDPNFSSPANVDANVDMKDNYPVYTLLSLLPLLPPGNIQCSRYADLS